MARKLLEWIFQKGGYLMGVQIGDADKGQRRLLKLLNRLTWFMVQLMFFFYELDVSKKLLFKMGLR